MLTEPADLTEEILREALNDGWGMRPTALPYQAVGFGSHHWLALDEAGPLLFVTVDDLTAKLIGRHDTAEDAFARLELAFGAAHALHHAGGLEFVVAPVPDKYGRVLRRLDGRYSVVVHPHLRGPVAGSEGEYETDADRRAVLELLMRLHAADPSCARADDLVVPGLAELDGAIAMTGQSWQAGPYSERARSLLATHASGLTELVTVYHELAARVAARPERMVVTHGEPHASNVVRTPHGLVLVDWDTILVAAPERDLWMLAARDSSLLDAYSAATGVAVDQDALTVYRMWYDLCEIAGYIGYFRSPHTDTADAAESWRNLEYFLRPTERWPGLIPR